LRLPPLRERKDDIPILIEYFMNRISKRLNKKIIQISDKYMMYLLEYEWPGNIRELENLMELIINTESIPLSMEKRQIVIDIKAREDAIAVGYRPADNEFKDVILPLDEVERQHIIKALDTYNGNITLTAKALGIGRNTLYRKIDYFKINCSETGQCSIM